MVYIMNRESKSLFGDHSCSSRTAYSEQLSSGKLVPVFNQNPATIGRFFYVLSTKLWDLSEQTYVM